MREKNQKEEQKKYLYPKCIEQIKMTLGGIIGILLALITAITLLWHVDRISQFFKKHQMLTAILAIGFFVLSVGLILQQDQDKKAASMEGTLEPISIGTLDSILRMVGLEDTILFSTKDNIFPTIELGHSGTKFVWMGPEGTPMFVLPEDQYIILSKERGQVKLSAKIRGKDGVVAEIVDNEWKVNPQNAFERNYNESALEIKDHPTLDNPQGEIILQIILLKDRIQFQGIFYNEHGGWSAFFGAPGLDFEPSRNRSRPDTIKPIFMYPSIKFLGKSVEKPLIFPQR
jgi:hypothetical protein